jgi:transcription initiation factor TFIIIB Brf1 subunit/transcription initiation factor TFIIB
MEDFDLLDKAIEEIKEKISPIIRVHKNNPWPDECFHKNITLDKNNIVCIDCGEELEDNSPFDKEWRFYGSNDNRYNSDPNRCQIRKIGERNIDKDIEGMGINQKIVTIANDIYTQVTEGGIHRGTRRKGIIFACIRQAYKISGKPQTFNDLIGPFNIERKAGLKGIKHVNMKLNTINLQLIPTQNNFTPKSSYITPMDLIEKIMKIFDAKQSQISEVLELYPLVKDKSAMLNGSRPWSLSSGLVYYWIVKNEKQITIKDFASKVELSELTIKKIYNEITLILKNNQQPG